MNAFLVCFAVPVYVFALEIVVVAIIISIVQQLITKRKEIK